MANEDAALLFLEHHGIKGMKWGVRKASSSGTSTGSTSGERQGLSDHQKTILKRVAIGAGVAAIAAGAAYAGVSLRTSGNLKLADLATSEAVSRGLKEAKNVLDEPTDIIHATRGKNVGFQFVKKGGLADPLPAFDRHFPDTGGSAMNTDYFKRHPSGNISASFLDPHGRTDAAGRTIPHEVVIPKHMTLNIHDIEDVKKKIWPLISAGADEIYNRKPAGF